MFSQVWSAASQSIADFKNILSGREGADEAFMGYVRLTVAAFSVLAFWLFFAFSPSEEHFFARGFFRFAGPAVDPADRPGSHLIDMCIYAFGYFFSSAWIFCYVIGSVSGRSVVRSYLRAWDHTLGNTLIVGGIAALLAGVCGFIGTIWGVSEGSIGTFFMIIVCLVIGLGFIGLFFAGGGGKALDSLSRNTNRYH